MGPLRGHPGVARPAGRETGARGEPSEDLAVAGRDM